MCLAFRANSVRFFVKRDSHVKSAGVMVSGSLKRKSTQFLQKVLTQFKAFFLRESMLLSLGNRVCVPGPPDWLGLSEASKLLEKRYECCVHSGYAEMEIFKIFKITLGSQFKSRRERKPFKKHLIKWSTFCQHNRRWGFPLKGPSGWLQ